MLSARSSPSPEASATRTDFAEELDDYPTEYELWPIDANALRREIDLYSVITKWKSAFESGAAPQSLKHDMDFAAENSALNDGPRRERTAVRRAFQRGDSTETVPTPDEFHSTLCDGD